MLGMNANTGESLQANAHLVQSIQDILTTRLGSRIEQRDYGSTLFELLDLPVSQLLDQQIMHATAEAIDRWEPRVQITRVTVVHIKPGHVGIIIEGYLMVSRQTVTFELTL